MDYEQVDILESGVAVVGDAESNFLVGIGANAFTGGAGADLFVVSYGTSVTDVLTFSTIGDFEVGLDKIGFIGLGVNDTNFEAEVTQTVDAGGLTIAIGGENVVTLAGLTQALDMEDDFLLTNPNAGVDPGVPTVNTITGTAASETLTGTQGIDEIYGLAGNDFLIGLASGDLLDGGTGIDRYFGGLGADVFVMGNGSGLDYVYDFEDGVDMIRLVGVDEADFATAAVVSGYRTTGTSISVGTDRLIVTGVDDALITADDFIFDDTLVIV